MTAAVGQPGHVHKWTGPTGVHFTDIAEPSGTYYREGVPREVVSALEAARTNGSKVRLFIGDTKTGECWHDEFDVYGTIGRSMGPIRIPLLIHTRRSMGGGAILVDCIVRLIVNGREAYRHPGYKVPVIRIEPDTTYPDLPWAAFIEGNQDKNNQPGPWARFKTELAANRWAAFMKGERMSK